MALGLALVVGACGGGTSTDAQPDTTDAPATTTTSAAPATTTTEAATTTTEAAVATTVASDTPSDGALEFEIGAVDNEGFSKDRLEIPAGKEVTITFNNQDTGEDGDHNFHVIIAPDVTEYATEVEIGPDTQSVTFTVLVPGEYSYVCDTHTEEMTGILKVVP